MDVLDYGIIDWGDMDRNCVDSLNDKGGKDLSRKKYPLNAESKLLSASPLVGPKFTMVTIKGENFGTDPERIQVYFNGVSAKVQNVTESVLSVEVPDGALTGLITLVVNGRTFVGPIFHYVRSAHVETFAGSLTSRQGYDAEARFGTKAKFNLPTDLVRDSKGNIYVSDYGNHSIRKITPKAEVSTFAGGGPEEPGYKDANGTNARFMHPQGLAIDRHDNIYVVDTGNYSIRRITPFADVSTVAGNGVKGFVNDKGLNARFDFPSGIVLGRDNALYVTEVEQHVIRRISLENAMVTTYSGSINRDCGSKDGPLLNAEFREPFDLTLDGNGNILVVDTFNDGVRLVDGQNDMVETFVGGNQGHADGYLDSSKFNLPRNITVDDNGIVYITDSGNHCIRKIDAYGRVTTVAGVPGSKGHKNGNGLRAKFSAPYGILNYMDGEIYVADSENNAVRKIVLE
ncbi:IPT/TIG domain-containing protein [Flagellimonas algicola]|uniref:IPT/TIG domain-containing protein n=1 Tax=Flagellimonas algicola TaxID=2583815 RepID=A0ABY2WG33_9FLAO|nr:IPT/TIG domain-containing protein [Allomuricauda algicola]TMU50378.1 hypothetical protein FGG15_19920 [Allomuricauda algicola]